MILADVFNIGNMSNGFGWIASGTMANNFKFRGGGMSPRRGEERGDGGCKQTFKDLSNKETLYQNVRFFFVFDGEMTGNAFLVEVDKVWTMTNFGRSLVQDVQWPSFGFGSVGDSRDELDDGEGDGVQIDGMTSSHCFNSSRDVMYSIWVEITS